MSTNFPGNPWADVNSQVTTDTAGVIAALNVLSYEQRTAGLVAYLDVLVKLGDTSPTFGALAGQIERRLGLDQEATS